MTSFVMSLRRVEVDHRVLQRGHDRIGVISGWLTVGHSDDVVDLAPLGDGHHHQLGFLVDRGDILRLTGLKLALGLLAAGGKPRLELGHPVFVFLEVCGAGGELGKHLGFFLGLGLDLHQLVLPGEHGGLEFLVGHLELLVSLEYGIQINGADNWGNGSGRCSWCRVSSRACRLSNSTILLCEGGPHHQAAKADQAQPNRQDSTSRENHRYNSFSTVAVHCGAVQGR